MSATNLPAITLDRASWAAETIIEMEIALHDLTPRADGAKTVSGDPERSVPIQRAVHGTC
jgi:hypothetical protein